MTTAVILGAGFSKAAGYPLTTELFQGDLPLSRAGTDRDRMEAVQKTYFNWADQHPGDGPEQWLRSLFDARGLDDDDAESTWHDVVQYVLRRLCRPRNPDAGVYYYGITRPTHVDPDHRDFWQLLRRAPGGIGVATFNYDILAEHGLSDSIDGRSTPLFYYGGHPYNQHVQKMTHLSGPGPRSVSVPLGHEVAVYKLHGSINWAWEPHSETLKVHDDVRAAFRERRSGTPAIVPPIEEKVLDPEFTAIWRAAERHLTKSERWVVCGYSAPDYDEAAREMLGRASSNGPGKVVELIDPNANRLRQAWSFGGVSDLRSHHSIRAFLDSQ